MAFRPPQQEEQGVPSLGYRLSSNRQPGIEQANNRGPEQQMPSGPDYGTYNDQRGRGKPDPYFNPREFDREGGQFDFRRNMPMPMPRPSPDFNFQDRMPSPDYGRRAQPLPYPFDRGGQGDPMPFGRGGQEDMMQMQEDMMPMSYVSGDDYGSYIPDSVLEGDRDFQYGPSDEYEFDYLQGLDAFPDFNPEYNRGGIAALRR